MNTTANVEISSVARENGAPEDQKEKDGQSETGNE